MLRSRHLRIASQMLGLHVRMFNKDNECEWFTFAFAPMRNKLCSSYEFIYKTIKEAWIRVECDIDEPKFRLFMGYMTN
ncbi:hypothetical protein L596_022802 [Steinernema carpocapsae]|uniref:Uncharacterized protein n=1 Tax=Steinernema carpocapsae TaxID=34508 RepID=A0A4U5MMU7_STECR|nr:hypothetical protein L596_022802 [Steinernema carpocapsae]